MHPGLEFLLAHADLAPDPLLYIEQEYSESSGYTFMFSRKWADPGNSPYRFIKTTHVTGQDISSLPLGLRSKNKELSYDLAAAEILCQHADQAMRQKTEFLHRVRARPAYLAGLQDPLQTLRANGFDTVEEFVEYGMKKRDPRLLQAANAMGFVITPVYSRVDRGQNSTTPYDARKELLVHFSNSPLLAPHFALIRRPDLLDRHIAKVSADAWPVIEERVQQLIRINKVNPDYFTHLYSHRPKPNVPPVVFGGGHLSPKERETVAKVTVPHLHVLTGLDDPTLRAMCHAGAAPQPLLRQALYVGNTDWIQAITKAHPEPLWSELQCLLEKKPTEWRWATASWQQVIGDLSPHAEWSGFAEQLLVHISRDPRAQQQVQPMLQTVTTLFCASLPEEFWDKKGNELCTAFIQAPALQGIVQKARETHRRAAEQKPEMESSLDLV